jgi:hypothetical protein
MRMWMIRGIVLTLGESDEYAKKKAETVDMCGGDIPAFWGSLALTQNLLNRKKRI